MPLFCTRVRECLIFICKSMLHVFQNDWDKVTRIKASRGWNYTKILLIITNILCYYIINNNTKNNIQSLYYLKVQWSYFSEYRWAWGVAIPFPAKILMIILLGLSQGLS